MKENVKNYWNFILKIDDSEYIVLLKKLTTIYMRR